MHCLNINFIFSKKLKRNLKIKSSCKITFNLPKLLGTRKNSSKQFSYFWTIQKIEGSNECLTRRIIITDIAGIVTK